MAGDGLEEVKARLAVGEPAAHMGGGISWQDSPVECRVLCKQHPDEA